ncbi:MAG: CRISPR-associated endoribonuclease Cas6 [Lachnospiraceae bacterium]|nr:CRISPR-associated endoribonuclease Cas6 [Lachnospiraceae bacterium]
MLAELKMELESDSAELGYFQSSNLQGVLMEQIDGCYAQKLHEQGIKPYSQYITGTDKKEWRVKTLTTEAYEQIMFPLLDSSFEEFYIEKKQIHVRICKKEINTISYQELLDEFYSAPCSRYLNLEFLTPTSFKSAGRYIIMPDMHYIYQSLMNKYSAVSVDMDMYDEETLHQLTSSSMITQYRLRSVSFPLEGIKIPSFKGEMRVKLNGTDTMAKYVRLLARFGEYAGVGIKTAIGMGGMKISDGYKEKAYRGMPAS